MTISIGADRAGFRYKERLAEHLRSQGHRVEDAGTLREEVCDYPVFAEKVARTVADRECDFGILICGSGEGMSIAANKIRGIRCGIAYNDEVAALLRQHNDANVVAFGANFMSYDEVQRKTDIFQSAAFLGTYHADRINMIKAIETK